MRVHIQLSTQSHMKQSTAPHTLICTLLYTLSHKQFDTWSYDLSHILAHTLSHRPQDNWLSILVCNLSHRWYCIQSHTLFCTVVDAHTQAQQRIGVVGIAETPATGNRRIIMIAYSYRKLNYFGLCLNLGKFYTLPLCVTNTCSVSGLSIMITTSKSIILYLLNINIWTLFRLSQVRRKEHANKIFLKMILIFLRTT